MQFELPFYQSRLRLLAKMIGGSVPFLNTVRKSEPWPFTLEDLKALAPGTLGAETAVFLMKRNFDLLPQYESHDMVHTLLGYNTTTRGELRLQAFMWGNRSSSFEGRILFLIGIFLLPELWRLLWGDFDRGRQARCRLSEWDFADLVDRDIEGLRSLMEPLP